MSKTTNKFAPEVRERAVRMVFDHERDHPSRWATVVSIADKIGCVPQTLHEWVKKAEIARVFAENFAVYGVRRVWRQMMREGFAVARCTVERLMREMGLAGVIRGKPVRTTISDKAVPCPRDHVNRQFYATGAEHAVGTRGGSKRTLEHPPAKSYAAIKAKSAHDGMLGQPTCYELLTAMLTSNSDPVFYRHHMAKDFRLLALSGHAHRIAAHALHRRSASASMSSRALLLAATSSTAQGAPSPSNVGQTEIGWANAVGQSWMLLVTATDARRSTTLNGEAIVRSSNSRLIDALGSNTSARASVVATLPDCPNVADPLTIAPMARRIEHLDTRPKLPLARGAKTVRGRVETGPHLNSSLQCENSRLDPGASAMPIEISVR